MRARAIHNKFEGCPPMIANFGSPTSFTGISIGKEYDVHALSVFQVIVFFQIVTDVRIISWLPTWFFELCELHMPSDWICNLLTGDLQMVIGSDFVATDEASYNLMVELDVDAVAKFWQRTAANSPTS